LKQQVGKLECPYFAPYQGALGFNVTALLTLLLLEAWAISAFLVLYVGN